MKSWLWVIVLNLSGMAWTAEAAADPALLKEECSSCHALGKPDSPTLERLWERKGPDLHYAGNKFNRDWLVTWLQNPTIIRKGGVMYSKVIKTGADGHDSIDTAQVTPHMKLSKGDAEKAADELMTLKSADALIVKGTYKNEPGNKMMAKLLFGKLRGCSSCHASAADKGGSSGPELYTGGERLQPDYIVAYMKDPQKFDPHIWMPTLELNEGDVQKLASFIITLSPARK